MPLTSSLPRRHGRAPRRPAPLRWRAPLLVIASLSVALSCAGAEAAGADQDAAQGAILYVTLCADCHGANGAAHRLPVLAGRPAAELIAQIHALHQDVRGSAHASGADAAHARRLDLLDAAQLADLAAYVSMLVAPPAVSNTP